MVCVHAWVYVRTWFKLEIGNRHDLSPEPKAEKCCERARVCVKTYQTSAPTCHGHLPKDDFSPPTIRDSGNSRRPHTERMSNVVLMEAALIPLSASMGVTIWITVAPFRRTVWIWKEESCPYSCRGSYQAKVVPGGGGIPKEDCTMRSNVANFRDVAKHGTTNSELTFFLHIRHQHFHHFASIGSSLRLPVFGFGAAALRGCFDSRAVESKHCQWPCAYTDRLHQCYLLCTWKFSRDSLCKTPVSFPRSTRMKIHPNFPPSCFRMKDFILKVRKTELPKVNKLRTTKKVAVVLLLI